MDNWEKNLKIRKERIKTIVDFLICYDDDSESVIDLYTKLFNDVDNFDCSIENQCVFTDMVNEIVGIEKPKTTYEELIIENIRVLIRHYDKRVKEGSE